MRIVLLSKKRLGCSGQCSIERVRRALCSLLTSTDDSHVEAGVVAHLKDFRAQLTNEVEGMYNQVGKLREERNHLMTEVGELLSVSAEWPRMYRVNA